MPNHEKQVVVRSMYGHHNQRGLVVLKIEEEMTQITPTKAREIAGMLTQAADAAEGDHFLVHFMRERVGLSEQAAAQVLADFRDMRAEMWEADREHDA
jgi:hypothetical protein